VLQQLLREQVSVRDLPSILETLLDAAATNKHPVMLVEAARQGLGARSSARCSPTTAACACSRSITALKKN